MEVKLTIAIEGKGKLAEAVVPIIVTEPISVIEEPERIRYSLPEFTSPDRPVLVWSRNFVKFS